MVSKLILSLSKQTSRHTSVPLPRSTLLTASAPRRYIKERSKPLGISFKHIHGRFPALVANQHAIVIVHQNLFSITNTFATLPWYVALRVFPQWHEATRLDFTIHSTKKLVDREYRPPTHTSTHSPKLSQVCAHSSGPGLCLKRLSSLP